MKHIRKFNEKRRLKTGDYVLVKLDTYTQSTDRIIQAKEYINTHIGKLININNTRLDDVRIEYRDVPEHIRSYFGTSNKDENAYYRSVDIDKIVEFGSTPEELEVFLQSKKFNL